MADTFILTREEAASQLGISTRTIDRYIRGGKLSYKKVANKILLSNNDINSLKTDFDALHKKASPSELVNEGTISTSSANSAIIKSDTTALEKVIDEKIDKFFLIFQEKDRMLEEKNKVIFMLQQRVGELENKIQTMVALPDYNQEKQLATIEKSKLEEKIKQLSQTLRAEKNKGYVFLGLFVVVALALAVGYTLLRKGMIAG